MNPKNDVALDQGGGGGGAGVPALSPETALLTVKEVSAILGLAVRTIWMLADSGRMPKPLRITPRAVRWRRGELIQWVNAGCPLLERRA